MVFRLRLVAFMAVLVLSLSVTGYALAQTDGPDPDSPIQLPTSDGAEEDATSEGDEDPTESAGTPVDGNATPIANATPVASAGQADLAAMTLDSSSIPDEFVLIGEQYRQIDQVVASRSGQIDPDALLATGIDGYYESFYIDGAGSILRSYVISYETVDGVQAGFDLLEDEETLVPNGGIEDLPGLPGVGEEPAEISTGTIENGDGTRTGHYDVTFRIDRFHVGAAMETSDGSEPLTDIVDGMARALADRVTAVLAGNEVEGVVYGLPDVLIQIDAPILFEGYQSVDETFIVEDTASLPGDYLSGYYRAGSFSGSNSTILPYVTIGVNQFESAADVEDALDAPETMMPAFSDLEELPSIDLEGADRVIAFGFSSPQGEGVADSVRLFVQVDATLISVNVQGMATIDEAEDVAVNLAELQLNCTVDGQCNIPGSIEPGSQA